MRNIDEIEKYFGKKLPESYRHFLISHTSELDGDAYLYLQSDVIERNDCYQTKEYAPGFINIGDNGGGMAFIISFSHPDPEVFEVGHGNMNPEYKEFVCSSFSKWQQSGFKYE